MEKSDIKALTMAYLGCFILTAQLIFDLKCNNILISCMAIGGFFIIKDLDSWNKAIDRLVYYNTKRWKKNQTL